MNTDYLSLRELLEPRLFEIPSYQRAYSWTERERKDLFNDIGTLLEPGEEDRSHFMATVSCLGPEANEPKPAAAPGVPAESGDAPRKTAVTVVDGQQRLTTLVILLKAIEEELQKIEWAESPERGSAAEAGARLRALLYDEEQGREIVLQSNHENSRLLRNYLRDGALLGEGDVKTTADANFRAACVECRRFVERVMGEAEPGGRSRTRLLELLATVEERLKFVYLELEDHATVYRVFETINSRGLVVDALDKSKSILMGVAASRTTGRGREKLVEELHKTWTGIYGAIGVDEVRGDDVLRFAATLLGTGEHSRVLPAAESIERLRAECTNGTLGNLHRVTGFLHDVSSGLRRLADEKGRGELARVAHVRLLYVVIRLARGLADADRERLLEQWERVTFRIFGMCRKDARTKRGDYTRLACRIYQQGTASATAKTRGVPTSPVAEIIRSIRALAGGEYSVENAAKGLRAIDWYERESYLRYLLHRYEEHLAGRAINQDTWNVIWRESPAKTIEHVFPQDPAKDWTPRFDQAQEKALISRLGNLAILPQAVNSAASNKSFEEKKETYRKNGALGLRHIGEICAEEKWGPEEIAKREEKIIAFAMSRWADLPDETPGP